MLIIVEMEQFNFPDLLSTNTGSSSALQFLVHKYKECVGDHLSCENRNVSPSSYPSRLLDVGILDDEYVVLHDTNRSPVEGPYFCLSHCRSCQKMTKDTHCSY